MRRRGTDSFLFGAARELRRDLLGTFERAMHEHGGEPATFRVGPPKLGFTSEAVFRPADARRVLATDAAEYDKDVPALSEFRRFVGDGLLTSDGDRWRRDRRIVAPLFTRPRIASYVPHMAETANRVFLAWEPVAAAGGGRVDVVEPAMRYALEVLGTTVFGEDMGLAEPVLREAIPVLNEHVTRTALTPVRLPSWVPTPGNRRAERARRRVWDFVDALIAQRRAAGAAGVEGNDLLTLLLSARDPETGAALDDLAVRDQALIFLLAGHETTGATLAFAMHLLGRHGDVQERVRDEVRAVVADGTVEAGHLEHLRYTTQVLDEAMRLYPAGHTVVRRGREPPRPIVAVSIWAIHRNPALWPDPERFDPDRFAERVADRYAHLPFGGGPRACIGQHLAMAEMVVALATVVRSFRLESLLDEPQLDVGVSLRVRGDLPCQVTTAAGQ